MEADLVAPGRRRPTPVAYPRLIETNWAMRSDFEGNPVEEFTCTHDARHAIRYVREIPLVAGDDVVGLSGPRAFQKLRIGWIGGDRR